jgi:hypothetical protein
VWALSRFPLVNYLPVAPVHESGCQLINHVALVQLDVSILSPWMPGCNHALCSGCDRGERGVLHSLVRSHVTGSRPQARTRTLRCAEAAHRMVPISLTDFATSVDPAISAGPTIGGLLGPAPPWS